MSFSQEDTTYFNVFEPSIDDLSDSPPIQKKFGTFSRDAEDIMNIPANIYIIEQKEILEKGHLTLVDVLDDVPGIITSQPGSALNGETFMMRGLLGNYYCKILIDDIPIQPSGAGGMPIAAQLPIRQAERIEVLFGPAAAIYGGDAMTGVINIITKTTRKSSIIQADLTTGNYNYNQINVLYAGRLGKVKKNIRYSMFANYTQQGDLPVHVSHDSIMDPERYYNIQNTPLDYTTFNNYEFSDSLSREPVRRKLSNESFMIGGTVQMNKWKIGYMSMQRKKHSALGLNPGAGSYADPSTYYGESINRFTTSYKVVKQKFGAITNFSYLKYRIHNASSRKKIITTDDALLYEAAEVYDEFFDTGDFAKSLIEERLRRRDKSYLFGGSDDMYIEQLFSFDFEFNEKSDSLDIEMKKVSVVSGANFQYSGNLPLADNGSVPFDEPYKLFSSSRYEYNKGEAFIDPFNYYNVGAFGQVFLSYDRVNILAGIRGDYHEVYKQFVNPRIAINYKLKKQLAFRAAYNTAHRTPSSFYSAFSYGVAFTPEGLTERRFNDDLKPEKLRSLEGGVRYDKSKKMNLDLTLFYNTINDKLEKEIVREFSLDSVENKSGFNTYNGFSNNNRTAIMGLKFSIYNRDILLDKLNSKFSLSVNKGQEHYDELTEALSESVFNLPTVLIDWNLAYRLPLNDVKIFTEANSVFSSSYEQGFVIRENINGNNNVTKTVYEVPHYYLLDFGLRYITSTERLEVFGHVRNVLNSKYSGIAATNSPDDIYFNPQLGRRYQIGVSYRLDGIKRDEH